MKSAQDKYEFLKIQLDRLNTIWSPVGETFSHQAAMHLRQAIWNDREILDALRPLMLAIAQLSRQYSLLVDPDTTPTLWSYDEAKLEEWNRIFAAASNIMDELESFLSQKDRDKLASETINAYKQLF